MSEAQQSLSRIEGGGGGSSTEGLCVGNEEEGDRDNNAKLQVAKVTRNTKNITQTTTLKFTVLEGNHKEEEVPQDDEREAQVLDAGM